MIKAVFIDIDDTLIKWDESAYAAIKGMFEKYNLPFCENIMEVYYDISEPLWDKVGRMEMTGDELRKIRWKLIFKHLNIDFDAGKLEKDYPLFLSKQCPLVDGAREAVEYLSSKYILCAASNAPKNQQIPRLEKAGLLKYFDFVFESGEVGCDKPVPAFFEHCLEKAGVKENEAIMIGDSLSSDVSGAKKMGFDTVFFNQKGKVDTVGATYEISSLYQIMDIL